MSGFHGANLRDVTTPENIRRSKSPNDTIRDKSLNRDPVWLDSATCRVAFGLPRPFRVFDETLLTQAPRAPGSENSKQLMEEEIFSGADQDSSRKEASLCCRSR